MSPRLTDVGTCWYGQAAPYQHLPTWPAMEGQPMTSASIADGYLLRGAVTVLSGQGAAGKSSLAIRPCVALASGHPAGRFRPLTATTVVTYNADDDRVEQRRRLSAACRVAGVPLTSIAHRIVRCGPLGVGTLFQRDDTRGLVVPTAAMAQLEALIVSRGASVLVVDPLAELHNADENDNTVMRVIVATFRSLAQRLTIAVLVIHHDRMGSATPGDMDRARGASALAAAARVMLTLTAMSTEEAEVFGIDPAERRRHVRLDSATSSYAASFAAEWWRLEVVQLDNGEAVAAAQPWKPPAAGERLPPPNQEGGRMSPRDADVGKCWYARAYRVSTLSPLHPSHSSASRASVPTNANMARQRRGGR